MFAFFAAWRENGIFCEDIKNRTRDRREIKSASLEMTVAQTAAPFMENVGPYGLG